MSPFRTRFAAALVAASLLAPVAPSVPVVASDGITALSAMADGVGRTWRPPETSFTANLYRDATGNVAGVELNTSRVPDPWWSIEVAAPTGATLAVGSYPDASSVRGASPYISLNATGCYPEHGSFEVLELETTGDSVTRLALRFTFGCFGTVTSRSGEYRYNSTIDLPGPDLAPHSTYYNEVSFGEMTGGTSSDPVTVTLSNRGTAPLATSHVAITGDAPDFFEIVDDSCSGHTIDPGASCPVTVRAEPPLLGGIGLAYLTFSADTTAGFGELLSVKGLTATSLEITTPAGVPAYARVELKARISPQIPTTVNGSVSFYVDGANVGSAHFDQSGEAVLISELQPGEHTLRAVYEIPCCTTPMSAPAEATKTVTGLIPAYIDLRSLSGPTVFEGTKVSFNATMTSSTAPASGTLRIRNASMGTTLATTPVSGTTTSLSTPLVALPVGNSQIVAEFVGDPAFVQATATVTESVVRDVTVDVASPAVYPTTFYPYVDGYRDTIKISANVGEPATATIRIFDSHGTQVRKFALGSVGSVTDWYAITWNGRTASGVQVPPGTYKVRQTIVDAKQNTFTKDTSVTLSWRRVDWITTSITKPGDAYALWSKGGTGSISKSASSFSDGVRLAGGRAAAGYAAARWAFTVRSGIAYKSLKLAVLGRGTRSTSRAMLRFPQESVSWIVGPGYAWWSSRPAGASGRVNNRIVLLEVETDGPMSGAFDVAKTRLTYTYAVWH